MNSNNRTKNMVIAGTLTGLILAVFLAFGGAGGAAGKAAAGSDNTLSTGISQEAGANGTSDLEQQVTDLSASLEIMKQRETEYRSQVEMANQTIVELQSASPPAVDGEYEDDDEHEEQEHEGHDDDEDDD